MSLLMSMKFSCRLGLGFCVAFGRKYHFMDSEDYTIVSLRFFVVFVCIKLSVYAVKRCTRL